MKREELTKKFMNDFELKKTFDPQSLYKNISTLKWLTLTARG